MSCLVDVDGYYVQCSSNFMSYGANWTVSSTFFSVSGATFESCQQLCSDNSSCISFYHRSDTLECHLSTSSVRTSADCPSCSYNIKQCWQGTCTCISCAFPLTSSDFKINSSNYIHIFKQKLLWPRASIAHIHLVEFFRMQFDFLFHDRIRIYDVIHPLRFNWSGDDVCTMWG